MFMTSLIPLILILNLIKYLLLLIINNLFQDLNYHLTYVNYVQNLSILFYINILNIFINSSYKLSKFIITKYTPKH